MNLLLNAEEGEFVRELLIERQRVLLAEISRAEHHEFRRNLQQKEALLESLITKLTPEKTARS
ncbi:MAG TPA: hypothetical protein VF493_07805 [Terriglobales bacterium]